MSGLVQILVRPETVIKMIQVSPVLLWNDGHAYGLMKLTGQRQASYDGTQRSCKSHLEDQQGRSVALDS